MPDFFGDLADGHRAEDRVLSYIRRKYPNARFADGRDKVFSLYDIFVPETGMKIEVKHDRYAESNGRIAVEVSYNGKQSGVYTSTADYWVFVVGKMGYVIDPTKLFIAIQGKPVVTTSGGSGVVLLDLAKVDWKATITLDGVPRHQAP